MSAHLPYCPTARVGGLASDCRCADMKRSCIRCQQPIIPRPLGREEMDIGIVPAWYAAWEGGYCTPLCFDNAVLDRVKPGKVWWLP